MARLPFYISGVRGGDLKRRVEAILENHCRTELTRLRFAALAFAAVAFVATPVIVGALTSRVQGSPSSAASLPRFEVASIKRTAEGTTSISFGPLPGARLSGVNNPPTFFIGYAHGIPVYRIVNAPEWLSSERYDLDARAADADASQPQLRLMLQALLEDRFQLRTHRETREGPIYVLTVARGGPKLRQSAVGSCVQIDPTKPPSTSTSDEPQRPRCGNNILIPKGSNSVWRATHVDMAAAASTLAGFTGRTVLNKTGVTGFFDIDVELPRLQPMAGPDLAPPDADVFTVLREQLGLVLERGTGPVEYLVIDRIERPTEN